MPKHPRGGAPAKSSPIAKNSSTLGGPSTASSSSASSSTRATAPLPPTTISPSSGSTGPPHLPAHPGIEWRNGLAYHEGVRLPREFQNAFRSEDPAGTVQAERDRKAREAMTPEQAERCLDPTGRRAAARRRLERKLDLSGLTSEERDKALSVAVMEMEMKRLDQRLRSPASLRLIEEENRAEEAFMRRIEQEYLAATLRTSTPAGGGGGGAGGGPSHDDETSTQHTKTE